MTAGIAALGPEAVARIVKTIAVYDDFCHANDPTKSTTLVVRSRRPRIFFKIDYFERPHLSLAGPSDPAVTKRVITIMLAEDIDGPPGPTNWHCYKFRAFGHRVPDTRSA